LAVVPRKVRSKDKVYPDPSRLRPVIEALQSQGKSIVLSNGVFDLLHVGHVRSLEDASTRGDFLIVALNDDRSAQAVKGKGRPIVPLQERMELISALWFVDYVTCFDADTADGLLETLRPDLYAKGTDYKVSTLPERDTLKQLGIKAVFVGDKKDHSTKKLIQSIRRRKL
jgi:rfaE bifunctional protein nucleotidyltransferase chain/domain